VKYETALIPIVPIEPEGPTQVAAIRIPLPFELPFVIACSDFHCFTMYHCQYDGIS